MKKFLIRLTTVFLLVTMLTAFCAPAAMAASSDYTCDDYAQCTEDGAQIYIISKDNCPIRKEAHDKGKVVARGREGELLSVNRLFWTPKMTRWAELNVAGSQEKLYVYIDNIKPHSRHSFINLATTANGSIDFCGVCGYSEAVAGNKSAGCDLSCVLDHAAMGSFSTQENSFFSVAAEILVGEIPLIGTAADLRDVIGDISTGAPAWVIAADAAGLLPIIGALKFSDELATLGKKADDLNDAADGVKQLPWGTWRDYDKITRDGREYVRLGDYLYPKHAVEEFTPAFYETNKYLGAEHSRGISPTYVNWILTKGVDNGTTIVSEAEKGRKMYSNGIFNVITEDDVVVTIERIGAKAKKK